MNATSRDRIIAAMLAPTALWFARQAIAHEAIVHQVEDQLRASPGDIVVQNKLLAADMRAEACWGSATTYAKEVTVNGRSS